MRHRNRGLTLLELLVAAAVFTVVGVMAYSALFSVLETRDAADRQAQRIAAVQYAVFQLVDDLGQIVDRPVRSQLPLERAPLFMPADGTRVLTLTRGGRPNPADQNRSSLVRVHWLLDDDGRLLRAFHAHVDTLPGSEPRERVMLENVESVELRFLDRALRWHQRWPSLDPGAGGSTLPWAIEVTLVLPDWGRVVRLVPLAGTAPTAPGGA